MRPHHRYDIIESNCRINCLFMSRYFGDDNVLIINKNLKAKAVCGKKYRSSAFGVSAVFSIPFVIMAIFVSAIIPDRKGRGVIIALIMIILLALPVALL